MKEASQYPNGFWSVDGIQFNTNGCKGAVLLQLFLAEGTVKGLLLKTDC